MIEDRNFPGFFFIGIGIEIMCGNRTRVRVCPRVDEDLFRAAGVVEGTQEGHQTRNCQHIRLYRQGHWVFSFFYYYRYSLFSTFHGNPITRISRKN